MTRPAVDSAMHAPFEQDAGLDILRNYAVRDGVADEMMGPDGRVKPAWAPLLGALDDWSEEERAQRFGRADQYLRDSGVFYRVYDEDSQNRDWPLSHLPVILAEDEWRTLSDGLVQRAQLLECLMADLYGANRMVAEGYIPPSLIASNSEFHRPLVGVEPVGGKFLHFLAFELGRGPDGRWWVLGDRTQAPSGSGFALENRVATSRAFADVQSEMRVQRIASFFRGFREHLNELSVDPGGRVAIMTPGRHNETYYEQAYIARYLGFALLQGEDMTVHNGRLMVRTVTGLHPVDVLWRRLDAAFTDPLELNNNSFIGTPGMVEAVRRSGVAMVNALGSGILETRALLAFLPAICRRLRGEELAVPSIATWWCGQAAERCHVADNIDRMLVGPAMSSRLHFEDVENTRLGAALDGPLKEAMIKQLEVNGRMMVGQEAVTLSTTPVYQNGELVPRPLSLRVFAARTEDGWSIMPGGFARIGSSVDPSAIAMQRGGHAADVWIVGNKPVESVSLLGSERRRTAAATKGQLPSRAADNLYWLGRYVERTEDMLRVLRAYHVRLAEGGANDKAVLEHLNAYLGELGFDAVENVVPFGFTQIVNSSLYSAGHIRDRFSPDGWLALTDLANSAEAFSRRCEPGDEAVRAFTVLLRKLAGFAGLLHENMYRTTGWRFLTIGRALERGLHMSRLLAHMTAEKTPSSGLDMMLEIGDAVMTYRRRYSMTVSRDAVAELLALDDRNPRSILFQLNEIRREVDKLPTFPDEDQPRRPMRDIMRLQTDLAVSDAEQIDGDVLAKLCLDLESFSDRLGQTYFA